MQDTMELIQALSRLIVEVGIPTSVMIAMIALVILAWRFTNARLEANERLRTNEQTSFQKFMEIHAQSVTAFKGLQTALETITDAHKQEASALKSDIIKQTDAIILAVDAITPHINQRLDRVDEASDKAFELLKNLKEMMSSLQRGVDGVKQDTSGTRDELSKLLLALDSIQSFVSNMSTIQQVGGDNHVNGNHSP